MDQRYGRGHEPRRLPLGPPRVLNGRPFAFREGVGIWPNPTDGLLNVTVREAGNYRVDVMNNLGQTVSSERLGGSSKLDLSGLAKGVYSVRVSTDAASMTQRVVLR